MLGIVGGQRSKTFVLRFVKSRTTDATIKLVRSPNHPTKICVTPWRGIQIIAMLTANVQKVIMFSPPNMYDSSKVKMVINASFV